MSKIDILLILLFIFLSIYTIYYDLKNGIIPNKILIGVGGIGIILKAIDYTNSKVMMIQFFMAVLFSIIFYALHVWAGGDAKLFIVISILIPNYFYANNDVLVILSIFTSYFFVYIFLVLDSIRALFKKDICYKKTILNVNIIEMVLNWLLVFFLLLSINKILCIIIPGIYFEYYIFFSLFNVICIIFIREKAQKLYVKKRLLILLPLFVINFILHFKIQNNYKFNIKIFLFAVIIFIIREWANQYSYSCIKINEIKKGMILSASSVLGFYNSTIKGLPTRISEDMSARLTDEEIESIKKWSKTKYGKNELIIVKKIPFAFFIIMGYMFGGIIGGFELW